MITMVGAASPTPMVKITGDDVGDLMFPIAGDGTHYFAFSDGAVISAQVVDGKVRLKIEQGTAAALRTYVFSEDDRYGGHDRLRHETTRTVRWIITGPTLWRAS